VPSSPQEIPVVRPPRWQEELSRAVTSLDELAAELLLPVETLRTGEPGRQAFPLRVPRGFLRRMERGNPRDPLLLQVLPSARESTSPAGFVADPLDELNQMRHPGLLQKYHGRALLLASGACAVNCRYCFRREFPYAAAGAGARDVAGLLGEISASPDISEVILSGGDPLTLSDSRLDALLTGIGQIAHVRRIRIHSRVPVVLPERVDAGLIATLARARQPLIMVLHANHANEIDATVREAMYRLAPVTATLLNQSVLLKSVNDDPDSLCALSETLFDAGVLPYYLHQLDPVRGAAHFRVSDRRARQLTGAVAARLPGYLVPRLVRETPGLAAKEILPPARHKPDEVT
jgi:EF-P beta-lysylation protein EpmB